MNPGIPKIRTMRIRYAMAFVTVAATLFFLVTLFWPLSVVSFRSLAVIDGSVRFTKTSEGVSRVDASKQALGVLVECVREEASEDKLDQLIARVRETETIVSSEFEYRDFASISQSIQVGVDYMNSDDSVKFVLSYDGCGTKDERRFLELLTERVAKKLSQAKQNSRGQLVFESPQEKIDRAIWIANQIESDLSEVANRFASQSRSSFKLASSSNSNRNSSPPSELAGTLSSIETGQLKNLLHDIKALDAESGDRLVQVGRIGDVSTDAVGSAPGWLATSLIAILSLSLAGVVTLHYDPFGTRGFDSVESIVEQLGIPVVATLKTTNAESTSAERNSSMRPVWANHLVEASTAILLVAMAVVLGFVLLDSTVRESFFYHPYDGLTRIVQVFMGY